MSAFRRTVVRRVVRSRRALVNVADQRRLNGEQQLTYITIFDGRLAAVFFPNCPTSLIISFTVFGHVVQEKKLELSCPPPIGGGIK